MRRFAYLSTAFAFAALTPFAYAADKVTEFGSWQADTTTSLVSESLVEHDFSGNEKPSTGEMFGITADNSGKIYWVLEADIDILAFVKATTYVFIFTNAPSLVLKLDPSQDVYNSDGSVVRYGNLTQDQVDLLAHDIAVSDSFTIQSTVDGELQSTVFDAFGFRRAIQIVFPP